MKGEEHKKLKLAVERGASPQHEVQTAPTPSVKTTPDLFIMESLKFSDEVHKRAEGDFLAHVLSQSREHRYYYFRTAAELKVLAEKFGRSRYRYLHISCHADRDGIATTLDEISYQELGEIFSPYLKGRRVFFSACGAANRRCAEALMDDTGCFSVMGPSKDVRFDDSAIAWASFYHRVFRVPDDVGAAPVGSLRRDDIIKAAEQTAKFFSVPFRFYYRDNGEISVRNFSTD